MLELSELQELLSEIAGLVKTGKRSDMRKAADKLQRLATIATTLGFTIRPRV